MYIQESLCTVYIPQLSTCTCVSLAPPKFDIPPEKWWSEDHFPFGMVIFHGRTVKLPGGIILSPKSFRHHIWPHERISACGVCGLGRYSTPPLKPLPSRSQWPRCSWMWPNKCTCTCRFDNMKWSEGFPKIPMAWTTTVVSYVHMATPNRCWFPMLVLNPRKNGNQKNQGGAHSYHGESDSYSGVEQWQLFQGPSGQSRLYPQINDRHVFFHYRL